ncbi:MAG: glycoside hydrolase family 20 zincin-like fold domain-containing protein [Bacteroidales bacterium]|jgi:hypothetical protein|nr:glycoside hydrolase family 20 zincin-like fold domain-containing protein [Bacteroidales bacterium]
MTQRISLLKITIIVCTFIAFFPATQAQIPTLIPAPQQMIKLEGKFQMNELVPVYLDKKSSTEEKQAVWLFCESYYEAFGKELTITDKQKVEKAIVLRNLTHEKPKKNQDKVILPVGDEGYQINIFTNKIEILANSNAGLYYGSQTLIQILQTSSLFGSIDCMTINDVPYFKKRGWRYRYSNNKTPDYNFLRNLIKLSSYYKYNIIDFSENHYVKSLSEMELFYLQKFAETYFVELIVDPAQKDSIQDFVIDSKDAIYPAFHQSAEALSSKISNNFEATSGIVVLPDSEVLLMDNWYLILLGAEMMWRPIKISNRELFFQRLDQFDKALNVQFFGTDFPLVEKMQEIDSLRQRNLTNKDFWQKVAFGGTQYVDNIKYIEDIINKSVELEEYLSFVTTEYPIKNEAIVLSEIFALQRIEFIVLKNIASVSLHQYQAGKAINIKEALKILDILEKNITHLQNAHATLLKIENRSEFPERFSTQYLDLLSEISKLQSQFSEY